MLPDVEAFIQRRCRGDEDMMQEARLAAWRAGGNLQLQIHAARGAICKVWRDRHRQKRHAETVPWDDHGAVASDLLVVREELTTPKLSYYQRKKLGLPTRKYAKASFLP